MFSEELSLSIKGCIFQSTYGLNLKNPCVGEASLGDHKYVLRFHLVGLK